MLLVLNEVETLVDCVYVVLLINVLHLLLNVFLYRSIVIIVTIINSYCLFKNIEFCLLKKLEQYLQTMIISLDLKANTLQTCVYLR